MLVWRGVLEMKQHINKLVILVIIGFFIMQFGNQTTVATKPSETKDLFTLAKRLQEENIQVDQWTIHARQKLTNLSQHEDVENYVKKLRERFPKWDWTISENQSHREVTGLAPKKASYQEKLTIVSTPTNKITQTYVIYEVTGNEWTDKTEGFLKTGLSSTFLNVFHGNPSIFTCIKAEIDDKIKSSLSSRINRLLTAFNAKEIESLKENSFISVSAASPLFAESLKGNHESMNLQLALRTKGLGAKTTLVVGTPIITIEY
jgi:hypothetical protein